MLQLVYESGVRQLMYEGFGVPLSPNYWSNSFRSDKNHLLFEGQECVTPNIHCGALWRGSYIKITNHNQRAVNYVVHRFVQVS